MGLFQHPFPIKALVPGTSSKIHVFAWNPRNLEAAFTLSRTELVAKVVGDWPLRLFWK